MPFTLESITSPSFQFSSADGVTLADDKFRGLQRHGPYRQPPLTDPPRIGFVFPSEYRDAANRLYLALRNGVGYFRGFTNMFRMRLEKDQVFPISGFSISSRNIHDAARVYEDALASWLSCTTDRPDILLVLHPHTPRWQTDTPYYRCKSFLLRHGLHSQDVTHELIMQSRQFEWSVANIALALFVKLGGIPWIVNRRANRQEIVIGVGRAHLFDPMTRQTERRVAFTTCLRAEGPFRFATVGTLARTKSEYLQGLRRTIVDTLSRVSHADDMPNSMTLHVSKEFGRDEAEAIKGALAEAQSPQDLTIDTLKITDEDNFFLVDESVQDGIPSKGACVKVGQDDFVLYTEGKQETLSWRNRLPTALRIRRYTEATAEPFRELLSQVYDLSQVNYRAFNATSQPTSLRYSNQVARLLSTVEEDDLEQFRRAANSADMENRVWFL